MSAVRSMLKRVAQLEQARALRPFPFDLEEMEAEAEGKDSVEWPLIIRALRRWKAEGVYDTWQRGSNRVWHL
jgi:hypothetical protein